VTAEGLEDQLLARVVKKERPDLEEQKAALISQQNQFKIQLKEIEDSLLYQLATAEGDLTENVELIENLEKSKAVSMEIAEKAAIAAQTEIDINVAREKYRPVSARSSTLFFLLNNLFKIHALYLYSLSAFVIVFERAIDQTEAHEDLDPRLHALIETITYTVWHWARRGMFEQHKLIVATQLTLTILDHKGKLDHTEVSALCMGERHPSPPMLPDNLSSWLSESAWASLHKLKELPAFSDIIDDMSRTQKPWKLWVEDDKAEKQPLPQKWNEKSSLQKLLIIRVLRPDRIPNALEDFVKGQLGDRYMVEPSFSMQQVFDESAHNSPVFFLLFPGVNPYADVEACGIANGYKEDNPYEEGHNLRRISMGQGQEKIAEKVIDDFSQTGGWVYLDNVHLMSKWISTLERKLEIAADEAHENFRCFSSAEPHPFPHFQWIPQGILESSIKVVNMPPSSLQANLVRAYDQFDQGLIDACTKGPEMRGMLFSLAFFHACVVGRRKFGAQGWSRGYSFNFGDLNISAQVLKNYLNNNDFVPWNDIKYIQGEVM
jgi:dynein heavy chain